LDVHYFASNLTPHLASLINELGLNDGLPYTIDNDFKCDPVVNDFFLSLVAPRSRASTTWRTYAEQLSFFFRFLSSRDKTWRDVAQSDFLHFYRLRRIQEGRLKISARSWNVFVAAARRFYKWAVRHEHLLTVPFDDKHVRSRALFAASKDLVTATEMTERAGKKDFKYLTEDDFRARFLPAVTRTRQGIRNALFVRLLMRSGLRADEAVTIKLSMLPNPDNPKCAGRKTCPLTVVGKGQKERTVRVPKSWVRDVQRYIEWDRADAVEAWTAAQPGVDANFNGHKGYVFLTPKGTPITYSAIYAMMRTAGLKSGFNFKTHPHMLRHSYAVYQLSAMIRALLRQQNIMSSSAGEAYRRMIQDPLRKLQLLLGHSCITSTFIYLDYVDDVDDMVDVTLDDEGFNPEDGYEDVRSVDG
jgi:integrase/recombinase XerC